MSRGQSSIRLILDALKTTKSWSMKDVSNRVPLNDADAKKRERFHKWLRRLKSGAVSRPDKRTEEFAVAFGNWLGAKKWSDLRDGSPEQISEILLRFFLQQPEGDPNFTLARRFYGVLEKADSGLRATIEDAVAGWEQTSSTQSVEHSNDGDGSIEQRPLAGLSLADRMRLRRERDAMSSGGD